MPLSKVSQEVRDLATKLQPAVQAALAADADATVGAELFNDSLPEDVSVDVVKRVQKLELDFSDALTLATAEASLEVMKKDKAREIHTIKAGVGSSEAKVEFRRSRKVRSPGTGEEMTVFGTLSTSLVSGIGSKRGNYAKIKTAMGDKAKSVFDN